MTVLTKDVSQVTYPGQQATSYVPEYTYQMLGLVCSINGNTTTIGFGSGVNKVMPCYYCWQEMITITVPAQEATSGTDTVIETDYNFGWNSGATSKSALVSPQSSKSQASGFSFSVAADAIGVAIGLTSEDSVSGQAQIKAGFYLSRGAWQTITNGSINQYPQGSYTDDTVFSLVRVTGGTVLFNVNGSTNYGYSAGVDDLRLGAALFSGGDAILSAEVISGGTMSSALAAMQVEGYFGGGVSGDLIPVNAEAWSDMSWMSASLLPLYASGGIFSGIAADLFPVDGSGYSPGSMSVTLQPVSFEGYANGGMHADLASVEANGSTGPTVNYGVMLNASMAPVELSGILRSGYSGVLSARSAPMDAYAYGGATFATMRATLSDLKAGGFGIEGDHNATIGAASLASALIFPPDYAVAIISSTGRLVGLFGVGLVREANLESTASVQSILEAIQFELMQIGSTVSASDSLSAIQSLSALMASVAGASGSIDSSSLLMAYISAVANVVASAAGEDENSSVWVLNVKTGATTRYTDFSFNSFARIGGHYFGTKADGIYLLEGDTDNGKPISTRVRTGKLDLGTKHLKRVSNVYLAVASDDLLTVTVGTDSGESYDYQARRADDYTTMQRVDTGLGLRSTFYTLEVSSDQADFELDSIEVKSMPTSRRIR